MYKPHNIAVVAIAAFFIAAPFVHAQLNGGVNPVQYIVAPETPGPNAPVVIEVQGVGTFLGDSTITWSQNGKVMQSDIGSRTFSFKTGALGTQTQIHVVINSKTQGTITNDWVFIPSLINLVWEADTFVPPFYKGKALYSAGSPLKVVAFPTVVVNGSRLPVSSLSFQWSRNNTPVPSASGTGRNTFSFNGDQLQNGENVAVDVYYGASKLGRGEVVIPAVDPQILLYVQDPLRGRLYDMALPNAISLTAKEISIVAAPYYFANKSLQSNGTTYTWMLNNNEITGPKSAVGLLTLRQTGSGGGSGVLNVSLQNNDSDKLVQAAETALQIVFGKTSNTSSLFGL